MSARFGEKLYILQLQLTEETQHLCLVSSRVNSIESDRASEAPLHQVVYVSLD